VVDATVVAVKVAAIRDAVARIRETLPPDAGAFEADRTAREVVILNLFVALQELRHGLRNPQAINRLTSAPSRAQ